MLHFKPAALIAAFATISPENWGSVTLCVTLLLLVEGIANR